MLFNSYLFIFLFLPVALLGYYGLNYFKMFRMSNVFLIGMSLWFYGYYNKNYIVIICGSIVINYLLAKGMERLCQKQYAQRLIMVLGICFNVGVIFYFKYFNFCLENANHIFGSSFEIHDIVLPLGISFYTFQQISYLVDASKGETKDYTFIEYVLFVTFFPQLIAGPIVTHSEMIPQFRSRERRCFHPGSFSKGMYIFALGLFKKVIIADTFGKAVAYGYGTVGSLSSMEAFIVSLSYTFQLFFDFSGYCDMAAGIGFMFHIELPVNFNSPYKSTSILEFWTRWHMTLTRFLRTYIYIPLGGNRKGAVRTYLNIMIVYLVSGIWHGANWTFILWGGVYGFLNCLNRLLKKPWEKLGKITQWGITFSVVNVLWIFFRADNIAEAIQFIKTMCSLSDFSVREEIYHCFELEEFMFIGEIVPYLDDFVSKITGFHLWIFICGAFFIVLNFRSSREVEFKPTVTGSLITVMFIFWSVISLAGISTFLYFGF